MKILVTGVAGFIGSAVCREIVTNTPHSVVNVDKLTYAANFVRMIEERQTLKIACLEEIA